MWKESIDRGNQAEKKGQLSRNTKETIWSVAGMLIIKLQNNWAVTLGGRGILLHFNGCYSIGRLWVFGAQKSKLLQTIFIKKKSIKRRPKINHFTLFSLWPPRAGGQFAETRSSEASTARIPFFRQWNCKPDSSGNPKIQTFTSELWPLLSFLTSASYRPSVITTFHMSLKRGFPH